MHKIVTHEYFMDYMQVPDIDIISKYLEYAEVCSWVQTRQIMLCSLKPYLKKKNIKPDEFFPLPIDASYNRKEELTTEVDPRAIEWFKSIREKYKENN